MLLRVTLTGWNHNGLPHHQPYCVKHGVQYVTDFQITVQVFFKYSVDYLIMYLNIVLLHVYTQHCFFLESQ